MRVNEREGSRGEGERGGSECASERLKGKTGL